MFMQKYIEVSALTGHIHLFVYYLTEYTKCVKAGCLFAEFNLYMIVLIVGLLVFMTLAGLGIESLFDGDSDA